MENHPWMCLIEMLGRRTIIYCLMSVLVLVVVDRGRDNNKHDSFVIVAIDSGSIAFLGECFCYRQSFNGSPLLQWEAHGYGMQLGCDRVTGWTIERPRLTKQTWRDALQNWNREFQSYQMTKRRFVCLQSCILCARFKSIRSSRTHARPNNLLARFFWAERKYFSIRRICIIHMIKCCATPFRVLGKRIYSLTSLSAKSMLSSFMFQSKILIQTSNLTSDDTFLCVAVFS